MRPAALGLLAITMLSGSAPLPAWTVSIRSVGPVRFGSTIAEFRRAIGRDLAPGTIARDCGYASTRDGQVFFYTRNGRVTETTVYEGQSVRTRSGIGIGSTMRDLQRAYPGRLVNNGGGSNEGQADDIVYIPADAEDQQYRIVFVVAEGRVISIAAGMLPDILNRGEASRCFDGYD